MPLIKKNLFLFLGLLAVVFFLFLYWLASSFFALPSVKMVIPPSDSTNIPLNQKIVVFFDKKPNPQDLLFSFSPAVDYSLFPIENTIEIAPLSLLPLESKVTLKIKGRRNKQLVLQVSFQTIKGEGSSGLYKEAKKAVQEEYPLSPFSPPDTAPFYFIYTAPLSLDVFLTGEKETAKKMFVSWVREKGIDLSKHQIKYLTPP